MYAPLNNLWEQSGIGGLSGYKHTGNWEWQYYPPPYNFLAPADSVAMPPPVLGARPSILARATAGLGCAGCGGHCGCSSGSGVGIFDSTDFSTWGWPEYLAIAGILYVGFSLMGDTKRGVKRARKYTRRKPSA